MYFRDRQAFVAGGKGMKKGGSKAAAVQSAGLKPGLYKEKSKRDG